jgi:hypothetical protein
LKAVQEERRTIMPITTSTAVITPRLPGDAALRVAQADAESVYRDLSGYRIILALEADGWHVDYQLKAATAVGGGPHYVIDAVTGAIALKRYQQ